jgi:ribosomal-protein-alanine N-acetyltransferase
VSVRTARLLLRRWREEDRAPFAALNADPVVMEHFPAPLTRAESDAFVDRLEQALAEQGYGCWAVEADGTFVGFTGLLVPRVPLPVGPCVEVGWRLARAAWGRGYATEAAAAAIVDARAHGVGEVLSFTATTNLRSQRVMQRLGMTHDPADDFDHPSVPAGSPLRRHVLYRLPAGQEPQVPTG